MAATLADLLAARREIKESPSQASTLAQATEAIAPDFYLALYDRLLHCEGTWEEHEEIIRLFVYWLGPAKIPCEPRPSPHWSQINWQVFRLAAFLLPKDALYADIQQAALSIWDLYKLKNFS